MSFALRTGWPWKGPWQRFGSEPVDSATSLLLDTMAAPAVAFSTRKLRTAYSGQCLRVRRSSDNAEQDIGFVANKLDTASLLTFVGAGDGFVVTWYDQSGNARNATQATAGKQLYVAQSGATITWGSKGDVAILNPFENRFLSYSGHSPGLSPLASLIAFQHVGALRGAVSWNVAGPLWGTFHLYDPAGNPATTGNGVARVLVASYANGDKRLRSSSGLASSSQALGVGVSSPGLIGTFSDGYAAPLEATYHTCILWGGALADIDTPYLATAAWL